MKRKSIALRAIIALSAFAVGSAYSYLWLFWACYFLGAGHGSELMLQLGIAPFGIGIFIWPVVFVFAVFANSAMCRWITATLVLAQYVGAIVYLLSGHSVIRFWKSLVLEADKTVFVGLSTAYVLVNLALWVRIVVAHRRFRQPLNSVTDCLICKADSGKEA